MNRRALLVALGLISSAIVQAAGTRVPLKIFTDLGLTSQEIAAIDAGSPVAKVSRGAVRPRCTCSARCRWRGHPTRTSRLRVTSDG
jgi:hypothetical protein